MQQSLDGKNHVSVPASPSPISSIASPRAKPPSPSPPGKGSSLLSIIEQELAGGNSSPPTERPTTVLEYSNGSASGLGRNVPIYNASRTAGYSDTQFNRLLETMSMSDWTSTE